MDITFRGKFYIAIITGCGIAIGYVYLPEIPFTTKTVLSLSIFATLAFLSEIYEVEIIRRRRTSTAIAVYTATIILGGAPLAAWTVVFALFLSELILRWEIAAKGKISDFISYMSFNTSQHLISVAIAASVFNLSGGHSPPFESPADYVPAMLAFLAYSLTNTSLVSGAISLVEKVSFIYQLKFDFRHLLVQLLSMGAIAILISLAYAISPWNIIVVLIPLVLVHISLRQYTKLRRDAKGAFRKMNDLLEKRDPYTAQHSEQVATLSEKIARQMGLPEERVERIKSAARIHDIGKIGISDEILLKPSKLTDKEWKEMKKHPVIGADMVKDLEIYKDAEGIIRHEHEQWDGSGYPDGLEGEDIPLGARIVAAADTYSAMTTDRPYRKALNKQEALEEIKRVKGTQLDPQVAEALIKVIK